mgnify:CR=1 FL=1
MIGNQYRKDMTAWNKGVKMSEETKEKIRKAKIKQVILTCKNCGNKFSVMFCKSKIANYCSKKCKYNCQDFRNKLSKSRTGKRAGNNHPLWGKKLDFKWRKKISEGHKGEKSSLWKGGISPINTMIRASFEYKEWRKKVFERDNYICVLCKAKGKYLNADHIKPFSLYPKLRFEVNNGRTLCIDCHKQTDTFAGKVFNYQSI